MKNDYEILGVSPTATDAEIKAAYHRLVKELHPDAYTDNPLAYLAEEKMKEINAAYERICQERKYAKTCKDQGTQNHYQHTSYQDDTYKYEPSGEQKATGSGKYYQRSSYQDDTCEYESFREQKSPSSGVKSRLIASILVIVGFIAVALACKDIIYPSDVISICKASLYLLLSCLVMVFANKLATSKAGKILCILPGLYCLLWNLVPRIIKGLAVVGMIIGICMQIIDPKIASWRITIFIVLLMVYAVILYFVSDKIFEQFTGQSFKDFKDLKKESGKS